MGPPPPGETTEREEPVFEHGYVYRVEGGVGWEL